MQWQQLSLLVMRGETAVGLLRLSDLCDEVARQMMRGRPGRDATRGRSRAMSRLLIVDDEETFRTNLAARLKKRGYDTTVVTNGEDAIKAVRADPDIDVVLLDRKMPGMEGEQVLTEMKSFRPELQVIMLTGHGSMESAMESGSTGGVRLPDQAV